MAIKTYNKLVRDNIPAIIEAAEASGAKWLVVEQDRSVGRTPLEAVQMSIEYLKG